MTRRLAFWIFVVYIFTLGWEYSVNLGQGSGLPRVVGYVALAASALAVLADGRMRAWKTVHILGIAFVSLLLLSHFWAVDQPQAVIVIRAYLQIFCPMWLLWELCRDDCSLLWLMRAYVAGAYVTAVNTIWTSHGAIAFAIQRERFAPEGWDPNGVAVVLAIGMPLALHLATQKSTRRAVRGLWWSYVILSPIAVVLTGSRGGVAAAVAGVGAWLFLQARQSFRHTMGAAAVFLATAALILTATPDLTLSRITGTLDAVRTWDLNGRVEIWDAGIRAFAAHPLLGSGIGSFATAAATSGYCAHNTFLSIAAELGVVGICLFIAFLAAVMGCALRSPTKIRSACIAALLCWIVCASAGIAETLRPTWFLFGLIVAQRFASEVGARYSFSAVSVPLEERRTHR